ncbi:MAG: ADP-ribosylglycohydrolase [Lachnospiraceae bacterium]|nr:ADP-ribosylglycohydrolase [Lachnospiraceae bacterium]
MLGAIIGDIVGSIYEFESDKTKNFKLFTEESRLTDDSMMTIAVGCACAKADLNDEEDFKSWVIYYMRKIGREFPSAGYGYHFFRWIKSDFMGAYNSFGNGSAMRVSPVAWVAKSLEEAEKLAKWSAEVTHNHPEGVKGAQAVAAAIYLARIGKSKPEIKDYIEKNYYTLDFTLDEIRPTYEFDVTCQGSVPQAIQCFFESTDFEDAIRNAISLGGDGDTQAAIAGAIAEAYYGIPEALKQDAFKRFLPKIKGYYDMLHIPTKNK